MSRYTTTHKVNGNEVAYGLDHALGWFYTEFDAEGDCVLDLDSMFTDLKGYELTQLLQKTNAPADHVRNPSLDLDPGVYDDCK